MSLTNDDREAEKHVLSFRRLDDRPHASTHPSAPCPSSILSGVARWLRLGSVLLQPVDDAPPGASYVSGSLSLSLVSRSSSHKQNAANKKEEEIDGKTGKRRKNAKIPIYYTELAGIPIYYNKGAPCVIDGFILLFESKCAFYFYQLLRRGRRYPVQCTRERSAAVVTALEAPWSTRTA